MIPKLPIVHHPSRHMEVMRRQELFPLWPVLTRNGPGFRGTIRGLLCRSILATHPHTVHWGTLSLAPAIRTTIIDSHHCGNGSPARRGRGCRDGQCLRQRPLSSLSPRERVRVRAHSTGRRRLLRRTALLSRLPGRWIEPVLMFSQTRDHISCITPPASLPDCSRSEVVSTRCGFVGWSVQSAGS